MTHTDDRPVRLVTHDEPPFDPDYDRPRENNQPPHDVAAEQAVLGALILEPNLAPDLATHLEGSDFYRPDHETIWTAIHHVATATTGDIKVDAVTLASHLARTGELERIGGAPYLHTLMEACQLPENATAYAKIVRDNARLRQVIDTGTRLTQLGRKGDVDQVDTYLGEALQVLDDTVTRFGPREHASNSGFRDLSWILTGQAPQIPPPVWVQHEAGHALFYAGKVNGVFGDPETAKTWLAQCAIVEALNAGATAAMIDVDHNGENHTAARLLLLGAHPTALADPTRFRYYDPQEGVELRHAIDDITAHKSDVVLIDSLGEIFPMLGLNTNDGDEITGGLRLISRPADTGSCVIFIDHLPKATEARATGFAIGSIAKKRAIRGSYIRAEEAVKPAPGQIGRINLFIEKDTAGELRRATPGGKYLGKFVLDSTQPHVTSWKVIRDTAITTDGQFRPTRLMERISRHVEDNDQCTGRDIREAVGGKPENVVKALKVLIEEGFISVHKGARNALLHHSISLYREAEDDNAQPDD